MLYEVPLTLWVQRSENLKSALSQRSCKCMGLQRGNFSIFLPSIYSSTAFILTKRVMKPESRIRSLSMRILWLSMEMYRSSGCQADVSILSNICHSEQEGMQQDHGFAQSALQLFPGSKVGWHKASDPGAGQNLYFSSNTCVSIHIFM